MLHIKPDYYDDFKCIADACAESCCKGWQIMIDAESLEKYKAVSGEIGERLKNEIDYKEGCFKQNGRDCAFLNKSGLCDLQSALGEEALCTTCKRYPRHIEEYENIREYSLSLSCPVAADMMLTKAHAWKFQETETEEYDDDFEDFDFLLFDKLVSAREVIYEIIDCKELSLLTRMELILELADRFEEHLYDDRLGEVTEALDEFKATIIGDGSKTAENTATEREKAAKEALGEYTLNDYDTIKEKFSTLYNMEVLNPGWTRVLDETWDKFYGEEASRDYTFDKECETALENILRFFIYTYFCGAVYDDEVYAKAAIAVYSTIWIYEISKSHKYDENDSENLKWAAVKYAREVEHSDINIDMLEKAWIEE